MGGWRWSGSQHEKSKEFEDCWGDECEPNYAGSAAHWGPQSNCICNSSFSPCTLHLRTAPRGTAQWLLYLALPSYTVCTHHGVGNLPCDLCLSYGHPCGLRGKQGLASNCSQGRSWQLLPGCLPAHMTVYEVTRASAGPSVLLSGILKNRLACRNVRHQGPRRARARSGGAAGHKGRRNYIKRRAIAAYSCSGRQGRRVCTLLAAAAARCVLLLLPQCCCRCMRALSVSAFKPVCSQTHDPPFDHAPSICYRLRRL